MGRRRVELLLRKRSAAARKCCAAPAANLTGVADLVASGSLTDVQRAQFPLGIVGFARYNPDLDADWFLHGSAEFTESS